MIRIFFLGFLFLISSCAEKTNPGGPNSKLAIDPIAEGESLNAGFLVVDGVYNSELMAPYDIFQHTIFHTDGGIKVFTVAPQKDTITTFEGIQIIPDYSFQDVPMIDILVVPSAENSMGSDLLDQELMSFVAKIGNEARYSISLCDGAFVLAKAGLIDGKESTTFPSDIDRYRTMFPDLVVHEDVSFVHHHNLLTSAGGAKSYDVALYLVHVLYGEKVAKGVGKGLVIDWSLDNYQFVIAD